MVIYCTKLYVYDPWLTVQPTRPGQTGRRYTLIRPVKDGLKKTTEYIQRMRKI